MEFLGILGDRGSGKTNFATAMAYDDYKVTNRLVVSNYTLNFPYLRMSFDDLVKHVNSIKTERDRQSSPLLGALIVLDELSTGADSYDFFLEGPRKISKLISQIRKLEAECIYTDQRYRKVAKRLREMTDAFVLMEDLDRKKSNHTFDTCDGVFRATFIDDEFNILKKRTFNGKPYQHLYNSKEIVTVGG